MTSSAIRQVPESPYSIAWNGFINGIEGRRCMDLGLVGHEEKLAPYLRNRLQAAFDAGWNAKESQVNGGAERG